MMFDSGSFFCIGTAAMKISVTVQRRDSFCTGLCSLKKIRKEKTIT